MKGPLTIVTYHYVRDSQEGRFPDMKALAVGAFREQVRFFKKHYTLIHGRDLIRHVVEKTPLPQAPLLLTFDDGYKDHVNAVLPILKEEGVSGCFFPPGKCVLENQVLEVNKIHFFLAVMRDKSPIVQHLFETIEENRDAYSLESKETYWREYGLLSRYDPDSTEVVFIKNMLHRVLPQPLRSQVIQELFHKYVTQDEASFARELYLSEQEIHQLTDQNMFVGSHGYAHVWMDTLTEAEQKEELRQSLDFLSRLGISLENWMMCYPFGSYTKTFLAMLRARGCCVGLTTQVGLAYLDQSDPLLLSRLDTNDFPTQAHGEPGEWTGKVSSAQPSSVTF